MAILIQGSTHDDKVSEQDPCGAGGAVEVQLVTHLSSKGKLPNICSRWASSRLLIVGHLKYQSTAISTRPLPMDETGGHAACPLPRSHVAYTAVRLLLGLYRQR